MGQLTYTISFDNSSAADANLWASELKEYILDVMPDVEVKQQHNTPYTQDLGTTLSLVLGTPAVIAVAKALGNWLARHRQAGITIRTPQGEIIGTNLTSKDALKLAELLLRSEKKE